jgi:C_GCAxxG_C_C family probable redox protein
MNHREKLLDEVFELALQNDMTYIGWTQSVLAALQEKLGVGNKEVFKAGSALAGGVVRMGETCGALIGSILAVCCLVGREKLEDRAQYTRAMEVAGRVCDLFRDRIGHTICAEIHKIRYGKVYHLLDPKEREAFHEEGGHSRTGCPEVCGVAARVAAEVIFDLPPESAKKKPAKTSAPKPKTRAKAGR